MIRKAAEIYDEAKEAYFVSYEAPGIHVVPVQARVPREERRAANIIAALLRVGADIKDNAATQSAVRKAINAEAPIITRVASVGWQADGTFVTAFAAHGDPDRTDQILPPADATQAYGSTLQLNGTVQGWQELSSVASYSTAMILSLSAMFAAPLLALFDWPSFALMLYGATRSGKSTAQWLAASAYGFVREEDMPNLRATSAGILSMAKASKDHAIFLNEAGTAAGRKRDVHDAIVNSCYDILGGRDVLRHQSWSGHKGAHRTFKTIIVISSEKPPEEWAQRAGNIRDGGELARLIGVSVVAEGHATVFDNAEGYEDVEHRADWHYTRLRTELPKQTGRLFESYADDIAQNLEHVRSHGRWYSDLFRGQMQDYATSALSRDIILKFSILYTGSMLAIDCKKLTLMQSTVAEVLKKACIATISTLPDPNEDLKQDFATLMRILESEGIADIDNMRNRDAARLEKADGIRQRHGGGYLYTVRYDVIRRWIRNEARLLALLLWLDKEGWIQGSKGYRGDGRTNWAVTQDCWIDRLRPRSVKIFRPTVMDHPMLSFDTSFSQIPRS